MIQIRNFNLFIYQTYPESFIINSHFAPLTNLIKSSNNYNTFFRVFKCFFDFTKLSVYTFINIKLKVSNQPFCQLTQPKVPLSTQPSFPSNLCFISTQKKKRFPNIGKITQHSR